MASSSRARRDVGGARAFGETGLVGMRLQGFWQHVVDEEAADELVCDERSCAWNRRGPSMR